MILKSLSRRSNSGQLINYVLRYITKEEKTNAPDNAQHSLITIRHNVRSRSIKGYIREFQENESYRIYKRRDSVRLFHTVLSFGAHDKEHIDHKILKDFARKFIELRGQNNLYIGAPHFDKDHTHLHLVVSGTQLNGRSSRLSKQEFKHLKLSLEAYQREHYPELIHSIVEHDKHTQQTKENLFKIFKAERQTGKQAVLNSLELNHANSTSLETFLSNLTKDGHVPYYRNGRLQGVIYENKKYRFSRLGFDDNRLTQFSSRRTEDELSLEELQQLRVGHKRPLVNDIDNQQQELQEGTTEEEAKNLEEMSMIRHNDIRRVRSRVCNVAEVENTDSQTSSDTGQSDEQADGFFAGNSDLEIAL
jgi:hypothetical protein